MDFTKLKETLDRIISVHNANSVDCIVYKEHEMIFRYFSGLSDVENNKEMNGNELYLIFSMTKMLTCTAALQLWEKGKYELSDYVSKYLPEFSEMKISSRELGCGNASNITTGNVIGETLDDTSDGYAKNQITIKDLFTMGAGLDYDLQDYALTQAIANGKKTTRELVGAMSEKILGFEPGTRFRYSLCHDVIGALVEIWSGQTLGEYMREHIFNPLEMKNTFFGVPKDKTLFEKMSARYIYDENRNLKRLPLECPYNLSERYESGGAGLTSCTEDYALFLDALACGGVSKNGNRILKPQTVKLMRTNHLNKKQLEDFYDIRPGYGYGLGVRTHINKEISGSLSSLGEFGWDGAAGAFSMVDSDNKLSLTYFQHIHNWKLEIQNEIRNALYEDMKLTTTKNGE